MGEKLTRKTKNLIKEAIETTGSTDRYALCQYIAEKLECIHTGGSLEYQLRRMGLETTKKILWSIDVFLKKYEKTGQKAS
ncbi:hypothetical protein [Geobacillus subterraneus]|uniref:Uncharacterized protein n=1 Tax=Geobacillus subterraneus TaxID=129338 RepID=A0A679FRZ7_9BACL|nr:hypothetical protein [Geobacillus subterraneus]BBW98923.1 hypothetical protein GsuE55_37560 [Geobacillus subterraneus]